MTATVIILAASNLILGLLVWALGWAWLEVSRRERRLAEIAARLRDDLELSRRERRLDPRPMFAVIPDEDDPA